MIYLHVGLHKTGTTFLQQAVFPKWKDIEYIAWPNLELFLRLDEDRDYLVSREGFYGQNWAHHNVREKSIKRLNEIFPNAKILISFRKHSGYIISSYKQYLHRGGTLSFDEYFDIDSNLGLMKKDDFIFEKKLQGICKNFNQLPFVFLHEEIRTHMDEFLSDAQVFIGGTAPNKSDIKCRSYNKSVGYYASKVLIRLNKLSYSELNPMGKFKLNSYRMKRLRLDPQSICQYGLSFLPNKEFISKSQVEKINNYYENDWKLVIKAKSLRTTLESNAAIDLYKNLSRV